MVNTPAAESCGRFLFSRCGGESGIRTHEALLTLTRFPSVRLKPLGHLSEDGHFTAHKKESPPRERAPIGSFAAALSVRRSQPLLPDAVLARLRHQEDPEHEA